MGTMRRGTARVLWLALAYVCVAIGLLGVVLPVLPTTPFILLAAFAADRGSPRLHGWLMRHRLFGAAIRDWNESRAVRRSAKVTAVSVMVVSLAIMAVAAPLAITVGTGAIMATVAIWLWTRPEPSGA